MCEPWFGEQLVLSLHKKSDDGVSLLREVNADNPDVRERVIQVLLVTNRFDEPQNELKADLAKNPPNAEKLLATWALACYEHHMYADAVDHATAALAMDPRDVTALYCRGRAHLESRPPDANAAVKDLEAVRQSSPNNAEVRFSLSDAYLMLNRSQDAITELEAGIRVMPDNKQLRMRLVALETGGSHPPAEALKLLTDVDQLDPFDKEPEIFQNESVILAKMGDGRDALARAEIARQLAPKDENIVPTELQLLLDIRNYQGVLDRYSSLDDGMKTRSWDLWDLAVAEKATGSDQAMAVYNQALAAAEKEDAPVTLDSIAGSIAQQYSFADAINCLTPMARNYVPAKIRLHAFTRAREMTPRPCPSSNRSCRISITSSIAIRSAFCPARR